MDPGCSSGSLTAVARDPTISDLSFIPSLLKAEKRMFVANVASESVAFELILGKV